MEYINELVKKNLIDLRESAGLKGYQVAEKAGISQASYSRYESAGWISDPEAVEKLASFYGVRSSRFYFDPDLDKSASLSTWKSRPSDQEVIKKLEDVIALLKS